MDWDLENALQECEIKLKSMFTVYEQEIEMLKEENKELEKKVLVLKRRLHYYKNNTVDLNEARIDD